MDFRALHDRGVLCQCVKYHRPKPLHHERHHILPKRWGGDSSPDNLVWLCNNAHESVHIILDALMVSDGDVPWEFMRRFNPYIRKIAMKGWIKWQGNSLW